MEIYVAGGAVRDVMLGNTPKDIDYVVVGSTPDEMISQGFNQVGAGFPVFLHPRTGEEYALARTERKTAPGYSGFDCQFDPSITLEDDLMRRDLTCNSMVVKIADWDEFVDTADPKFVIDPYGGLNDLKDGVLRHTSEAFSEDPIRVLRTARFAARYGFIIHDDTMMLMSNVVHELNSVPQERIWAEFEKGLKEQYPYRMICALRYANAFKVQAMVPYAAANPHTLMKVAKQTENIGARFVTIASNFTDEDFAICKIPTDVSRVCKAYKKYSDQIEHYPLLSKQERLDMFMDLRAISSDNLIITIMDIAIAIGTDQYHRTRMLQDLKDCRAVNSVEIASQYTSGEEIKQKIREARLKAMLV